MKKVFILIALPLLLIANTASAQSDLTGFWCIDQVCIGPTAPDPPGGFVIQILNQTPEGLFEVINCSDPGADPCYGIIDGKNIYITCWDNIIVGVETKKGIELSYISQIQNPDSRTASTCKGTATKLPLCTDCEGIDCDCPQTP